jgi:ABC-type uncharacterized transport system substrate-binding protein
MSDNRKMYRFTAVWMIFCLCGIFSAAAQAGTLKDLVVVKSKVLVIMSYDDSFPWVTETKEGIDSVLSQTCEVRYFYMDTKRNPPGAAQKAKEAFSLYQEFQPDGVIASDDDAQSAFAVPYLKDKVKTPVMFCGVNADAGKYGYPAANVSGILERYHVSESVAFVRQIIPSVKTFGYIMTDGSTGKAALEQIQSEAAAYPAKFTAYKMPKTLKETKAMTEELKSQCDTLFTPTMQGIVGDDGKSLSDKEVLPIVAEIFGKAVIGGSGYNIKYGMLCGVIKTGQEQGNMAAKMLLKAMGGTPVSQIPIIRNQNGKRIVNVTVMKALGVKPNPAVLEGAELVRTEK